MSPGYCLGVSASNRSILQWRELTREILGVDKMPAYYIEFCTPDARTSQWKQGHYASIHLILELNPIFEMLINATYKDTTQIAYTFSTFEGQ
jgi:hypothetical protein